MNGIALAELKVIQDRIIAELIAASHKLLQPQRGVLFGSQCALFTETFTFLIQVMKYSAHRLLIGLAIIMNQHLPHHFLFRYACFVAVFGKVDEQRL